MANNVCGYHAVLRIDQRGPIMRAALSELLFKYK